MLVLYLNHVLLTFLYILPALCILDKLSKIYSNIATLVSLLAIYRKSKWFN